LIVNPDGPKEVPAKTGNIVDVLAAVGIAASKREARQLLDQGGIMIKAANSTQWVKPDKDFVFEEKHFTAIRIPIEYTDPDTGQRVKRIIIVE
jgi:tyrosyl-tRNA synthetase